MYTITYNQTWLMLAFFGRKNAILSVICRVTFQISILDKTNTAKSQSNIQV